MQTSIYRINKQQGLTVKHRELYSISCDKPEWKKYEKECMCVYTYIYIYKNFFAEEKLM